MALFYFKGLQDPERIKSIVGCTDLFVEECSELTQDDFDQLCLRIRAKVPFIQIFSCFNPISKANWTYKRWFDDDTKDLKNTIVIKTTYRDNKFLPQSYIDSLENMINTNPTYYKIYALGDFCSLNKLVYNNWEVKDFDYTTIKGELCIGLDFGYITDPTALVASIVDPEAKTIYVFDEYYEKGRTNDQIAAMIKMRGYSKSNIIADSAEQKSIEEIRRLGVFRIRPSMKGPDSIMSGIQYIQQYRIFIHPSLENIKTELENYAFKKDKQTNEYINQPCDSYNHLLDALRYSMQIVWNPKKLTTMDKSLFGFN